MVCTSCVVARVAPAEALAAFEMVSVAALVLQTCLHSVSMLNNLVSITAAHPRKGEKVAASAHERGGRSGNDAHRSFRLSVVCFSSSTDCLMEGLLQ